MHGIGHLCLVYTRIDTTILTIAGNVQHNHTSSLAYDFHAGFSQYIVELSTYFSVYPLSTFLEGMFLERMVKHFLR